MANAPAFTATPNIGSGLVPATADTSRTAPTNTTTILTGGANGTKIEEITFIGVGTTVLGGICVFRYDGSYHLEDEVSAQATTPSTTVLPWSITRVYTNLWLKSGETLRVTTQISGNQSLVCVSAKGGDL